jgi:hypothetical protein
MSSKPKNLPLAILLLCTISLAPVAAAQKATYQVTPGNTDPNGFPLSGASVCLSPAKVCFQMPDLQRANVTYPFALEPHARAIMEDPSSWLLFDATFSAGGSGTLTRYAVLKPSGDSLINLLPSLALTNQSDFAIWNDTHLSPYPVVISADFVWDFHAGETHFSKHRYRIEVWQYDKPSSLYTKVLSYRTTRRYDGLDDVEKISVITPERSEILRRLTALHLSR